ncbi:MAG: transglutaminase-like domain-containing protein, partial [Coriobacteriales bacterium]|nr:transglutaminase-like domain-containing protein [Coriobacteriales bacterium]
RSGLAPDRYLAAPSDTSGVAIGSTTDKDAALRLRFEKTTSGIAELDAKLAWIRDNKIGTDGDVLRRSFDYVVNNYVYRSGSLYPSGDWAPPFALEMINNGGGNCYHFAALFCVLAQSYGYDATVISGSVPSLSGGWVPHGWVEVRLNGTVYVCDPDLAYEIRGYNWFMITYGQAPTTYKK